MSKEKNRLRLFVKCQAFDHFIAKLLDHELPSRSADSVRRQKEKGCEK